MEALSTWAPGHNAEAEAVSTPATWEALLCRRLVEISGTVAGGGVSCAVHLLAQAQGRGETAAWIQPQGGSLYPPDLHECGVDLQALAVVHVPATAGPHGIPKAAEILLRSGAYGLLVLDLAAGAGPPAGPWQGRLLALARLHGSAVLLLTHKSAQQPSLGAQVSFRIEPQRQPLGSDGRLFLLGQQVLKNKTSLSWPSGPLQRRGPWGLW